MEKDQIKVTKDDGEQPQRPGIDRIPRDSSSWKDAFKAISVEDINKIHYIPCVREALMSGIVAGFVVGGGQAIFRKPVMTCSNYAVGTFAIISSVIFEGCRYRRMRELSTVKIIYERAKEKTPESDLVPKEESELVGKK